MKHLYLWFNRFIQQKLGGPSLAEYEKLQAEVLDLQTRYDKLFAMHQEKCREVYLSLLSFYFLPIWTSILLSADTSNATENRRPTALT